MLLHQDSLPLFCRNRLFCIFGPFPFFTKTRLLFSTWLYSRRPISLISAISILNLYSVWNLYSIWNVWPLQNQLRQNPVRRKRREGLLIEVITMRGYVPIHSILLQFNDSNCGFNHFDRCSACTSGDREEAFADQSVGRE